MGKLFPEIKSLKEYSSESLKRHAEYFSKVILKEAKAGYTLVVVDLEKYDLADVVPKQIVDALKAEGYDAWFESSFIFIDWSRYNEY
jgi:hypothetical protein